MLVRWLLGSIAGTMIIAVTSPWFIRSYPQRVFSQERGVVVYQQGAEYRWRSEGYATTRIGPQGRPGESPVENKSLKAFRVALWGDSQAEGNCVPDDQKIAPLTEASVSNVAVENYARSGDDCNDWIHQIQRLNETQSRAFNAHVFLITEWQDWCIDVEAPSEFVNPLENQIARYAPAFTIQAVRNALTVDAAGTRRELRWTLGPVNAQRNSASGSADDLPARMRRLNRQLDRLKQAAVGNESSMAKVVFLYAPLTPSVTGDRIIESDDGDWFVRVLGECAGGLNGVAIDLRPQMIQSARAGNWPRGFQHGRFGSGHYNPAGNAIIATRLARQLEQWSQSSK